MATPGRPQGGSPGVRKVRCPQCGGESPWSEANKWRPFCSERCKMIDLGAWASESYRVPVQEDNVDPADLPPAE